MRRYKEIIVLLALLVGAMTFVLWYVIDRRAKNRARPPATTHAPTPGPELSPGPLAPSEPVLLGTTETERKTIDFSSGQGVVKDTPEDKAALEAGLRDIADATKDVTFEAAKPAEAPKK